MAASGLSAVLCALEQRAKALFPAEDYIISLSSTTGSGLDKFGIITRQAPHKTLLRYCADAMVSFAPVGSTPEQTHFLAWAVLALANLEQFVDNGIEGVNTLDDYLDHWMRYCH